MLKIQDTLTYFYIRKNVLFQVMREKIANWRSMSARDTGLANTGLAQVSVEIII